jgi:hypothetical protein
MTPEPGWGLLLRGNNRIDIELHRRIGRWEQQSTDLFRKCRRWCSRSQVSLLRPGRSSSRLTVRRLWAR